MSIQEAIARRREARERTLLPRYDLGEGETSYQNELLRKAAAILVESGATTMWHHLREIIGRHSPDVETHPLEVVTDGKASMHMRWNRRGMEGVAYRSIFDVVDLIVRPLTGDLEIHGREHELVRREQWKQDPTALENALAQAYHEPMRLSWPPIQIG